MKKLISMLVFISFICTSLPVQALAPGLVSNHQDKEAAVRELMWDADKKYEPYELAEILYKKLGLRDTLELIRIRHRQNVDYYVKVLYGLSMVALDDKGPASAIYPLELIIKIDPNHRDAKFDLANFYWDLMANEKKDLFDKAKQTLESVLTSINTPNNSQGKRSYFNEHLFNLGTIYLIEGNIERALPLLEESHKLGWKTTIDRKDCLKLIAMLRKYIKDKKTYKTAMSYARDFIGKRKFDFIKELSSRKGIERGFWFIDQKRFGDAVTIFGVEMMKDSEINVPLILEHLHNVVERLLNAGNLPYAEKVISIMLSLDPADDIGLALAGDYYARINNLGNASDCYKHSLVINPDNEQVAHKLSEVERSLDESQIDRDAIEKAAKDKAALEEEFSRIKTKNKKEIDFGRFGDVVLELVRCYETLSDLDCAKAVVKEAQKLSAKNQGVKDANKLISTWRSSQKKEKEQLSQHKKTELKKEYDEIVAIDDMSRVPAAMTRLITLLANGYESVSDVWIRLGLLESRRLNYAKAITYFSRALKSDRGNEKIKNILCAAMYASGHRAIDRNNDFSKVDELLEEIKSVLGTDSSYYCTLLGCKKLAQAKLAKDQGLVGQAYYSFVVAIEHAKRDGDALSVEVAQAGMADAQHLSIKLKDTPSLAPINGEGTILKEIEEAI